MDLQDNLHVPMDKEKAKVELVTSSFKLHNFSAELSSTLVCFQVLKMEDSLFVWIGSFQEPTFADLSLSMNTNYDKLPLTTKLMGSTFDSVSSNLATKLTKKLGKPAYVSFNLTSADRFVIEGIEKRLQQEMKSCPEKFH